MIITKPIQKSILLKKETTKLTKDDITTNFLTLLSVITVTFNSKTKIVTKTDKIWRSAF